LILQADAESADFGRAAVTGLIGQHVLAGEKVWFPNQYGANWYAPAAGGELVVPGVREPKPGDLFIVGNSGGLDLLEKSPNRTLVQVLTHKYRLGRTMGEGAGLYANDLGNLLWTFRHSQDDRFEVWRFD